MVYLNILLCDAKCLSYKKRRGASYQSPLETGPQFRAALLFKSCSLFTGFGCAKFLEEMLPRKKCMVTKLWVISEFHFTEWAWYFFIWKPWLENLNTLLHFHFTNRSPKSRSKSVVLLWRCELPMYLKLKLLTKEFIVWKPFSHSKKARIS
jgi:hypothetical protein